MHANLDADYQQQSETAVSLQREVGCNAGRPGESGARADADTSAFRRRRRTHTPAKALCKPATQQVKWKLARRRLRCRRRRELQGREPRRLGPRDVGAAADDEDEDNGRKQLNM